MPKFRKKPIVIEAFQWNGEQTNLPSDCEPYRGHAGELMLMVHTLEGPMSAKVGAWIITGIKGERYPCQLDIFEATYEPVEGT